MIQPSQNFRRLHDSNISLSCEVITLANNGSTVVYRDNKDGSIWTIPVGIFETEFKPI